jgi:hypothetical protein
MISQFTPPTVDGFSRFVYRWLSLLSEWRFDEAAALIDAPAPDGRVWGIEEIQDCLREYAGDSGLPCITDPASMGAPCGARLTRFEDVAGFRLEFPVPIDGDWSELKVRFGFFCRPGGYAVALCGFANSHSDDETGPAE